MSFKDKVAAGAVLIKDALQSAGYVAGVSGWQVRRDGNAEFNGLTVRGDLNIADLQSSFADSTGRLSLASLVPLLRLMGASTNDYVPYPRVQFNRDSGVANRLTTSTVISSTTKSDLSDMFISLIGSNSPGIYVVCQVFVTVDVTCTATGGVLEVTVGDSSSGIQAASGAGIHWDPKVTGARATLSQTLTFAYKTDNPLLPGSMTVRASTTGGSYTINANHSTIAARFYPDLGYYRQAQ